MILELNHKKLTLFNVARVFVKESYKLSSTLPFHEKFNTVQQINRAATSVLLNIAEGASRSSKIERKRFYEIARGSVIEVDAALQICYDVNYITNDDIKMIAGPMKSCFYLLSKMISTINQQK